MRRLLPSPADHVDLDEAYAYPDSARWLRANMVMSVDGAATADGLSAGLSNEADRRLFFTLRGLADVVLVGASTVRREGYGPARPNPRYAERRAAAGQQPAPLVAVVTGSLDLDFTSKLFTAPSPPTIVITSASAPSAALAEARSVANVVVAGEDRVDLGIALDALVALGHTRLLTEGGPHLLAQLVTTGLLDELCLTVSPLLTGSDVALRIVSGAHLDPPLPLRLRQLLAADDCLFASYLLGA